MQFRTKSGLAIAAAVMGCSISGSAHAQLLDDDFDNGNIATGGVNGGFQLTQNTAAATASSGEAASVGTVTTGGANNNAGLYSSGSIDLASQIGFTATFVVDNAPTAYFNNGLMLGITEDATTFYRSAGTANFGIILGTSQYGQAGNNDLLLVSNDSGGGVIQSTILSNVDLTNASSGFTASFTVLNNNQFSYRVTGLTASGSLTGTGTLGGGVTYANQFDSAEHAFGSLQSGGSSGQFNRTLGLDRVTVTAPTYLPTETINVSDLTTNAALNTVTPSVLGTHVARGRADTSQNDLQVANFMNFDVSMLTTGLVNSASFKAEIQIDLVDILNNVNAASVSLGRNDSGTWDASGTNNPLHDWGLIDETSTIAAENVVTLVDNLLLYTDADGDLNNATAFTADITDIVKGWVNGDFANQGLVLFTENEFQAGGFENAQLVITPEPSSLALLALGGLLAARRRR